MFYRLSEDALFKMLEIIIALLRCKGKPEFKISVHFRGDQKVFKSSQFKSLH